jgi:hypothetical protein
MNFLLFPLLLYFLSFSWDYYLKISLKKKLGKELSLFEV